MNSLISSIQEHGEHIFLSTSETFNYNDIITGCPVRSKDGYTTRMYAVSSNTWRGFHRINKSENGAGSIFVGYFINNREWIIRELSHITDSKQLDTLEHTICSDIKNSLNNIRQDMLTSYNKVRKPVDLFIEHIVSMAR